MDRSSGTFLTRNHRSHIGEAQSKTGFGDWRCRWRELTLQSQHRSGTDHAVLGSTARLRSRGRVLTGAHIGAIQPMDSVTHLHSNAAPTGTVYLDTMDDCTAAPPVAPLPAGWPRASK
jgi:hypothetical protein